MTAPRSPYQDTSVTVGRSQDQIRSMLRRSGAEGVSFSEEWNPPKAIVRFLWRADEESNQVTVRLEVTPLPAEGRSATAREKSAEQRWRQAWRGIAWYLDATLKAAAFGLVRFEDIFLSFIEIGERGRVGDVLIPQLLAGPLELPEQTGVR